LKVRLAHETLFGFLLQSNISAGNIRTMESFGEFGDEKFSEFLGIVTEIAKVKPRKRRRWRGLRVHHPALMRRVEQNQNFDWLLDMIGEGEPLLHEEVFEPPEATE
jgi:hypothetical protein